MDAVLNVCRWTYIPARLLLRSCQVHVVMSQQAGQIALRGCCHGQHTAIAMGCNHSTGKQSTQWHAGGASVTNSSMTRKHGNNI